MILVDALDEGDPPEQQRPGYKGGVMACANKALMLVIKELAGKLPEYVRWAPDIDPPRDKIVSMYVASKVSAPILPSPLTVRPQSSVSYHIKY